MKRQLLECMSLLLCRFSDAGMRTLSTRCGGRRPKSANARSRGKLGTGWQRVLWGSYVGGDLDGGRGASRMLPQLSRFGMNVAKDCAIDRSIGVRWHGADQFLASRNIHDTFKQTWFALFVKTTLSLRYGGVDVTRRIRVPACQMILAVLDHALHAADRVDLATPPSLSSRPAAGLSALAPAQRAGAQRLRALARLRHAGCIEPCPGSGAKRKIYAPVEFFSV
jgi:hypothetical protein